MNLRVRTQKVLGDMGRGAVKLRGQHFLVEERVLERIVAVSGVAAGMRVLEIGPGLGFLTEKLLAKGCIVIAIELDPGFSDYLEQRFAAELAEGSFRLIRGNALEMDMTELFAGSMYTVVANIPYNISAPLLEQLVDCHMVEAATLLVQKEVAERVCAAAPEMNIQALLVQAAFVAEVGFVVPAGAFMPPPKVQSAVLMLRRKQQYADGRIAKQPWFALAKRAFLAPRKKIANTLEMTGEHILKAGLTGDERPSELSALMWQRLAE